MRNVYFIIRYALPLIRALFFIFRGLLDAQLRELRCGPAENARIVARNKENIVTLQVQVAIEHGYEMLSWGYQDVERSFLERYCRM